MAPESICERKYSKASDVWSFGITVIEILTGGYPYPSQNAIQVFIEISKGINYTHPIPENCPPYLEPILKDCWKYAPEQRPTFSEIYQTLQNAKLNSNNLNQIYPIHVKLNSNNSSQIYSIYNHQTTERNSNHYQIYPKTISHKHLVAPFLSEQKDSDISSPLDEMYESNNLKNV